jgi:transposase
MVGENWFMPAHPAPALVLRDGDRDRLGSLTRASSGRAGLAQRARIVLLASEGVGNTEIASRLGCARQTVIDWRARYDRDGIDGLGDEQRPGRPRTVDRAEIIAATLSPPPKKLGITHWSSRLLAAHLRVAQTAVVRTWRDYGVAPWRSGTFKFSTDPELVAKVVDVVGLYLAPPENAIVLCVDEKSQIQALDRTAPLLPMRAGSPEQRTHDYVRHGTTTLFAALEVATGKVTGIVQPRHRHQEFLRFLQQIARAYPDDGTGRELHLVMDNYAAHKRVEIREWLAANPRIQVHFTPTSASWLNMVEIWFGIIERQAIRRGTFRSVKELNAKIRHFINGWNDRAHPFVWTKTAEDILAKAKRPTIINSGH